MDLPMPTLPPGSLLVHARDPAEMERAQAQLVTWARGMEASERANLAEVEENLALARERKWKLSGWQRQVRLARKRVTFFEKVKLALERNCPEVEEDA